MKLDHRSTDEERVTALRALIPAIDSMDLSEDDKTILAQAVYFEIDALVKKWGERWGERI